MFKQLFNRLLMIQGVANFLVGVKIHVSSL